MSHPRSGRHFVAGLLTLLSISGCSRQSVHGDSVTYGYSWLVILSILAVAITVTAIGAYKVFDNRRIAAQQARRKKKREPSENEGVFGLVYGLAILAGGAGLLLILVPSLYLSYVTVSPDHVVIRDSLLWFSGAERVIPFEDTASLSVEEREVRTRRGGKKIKKILHIARIQGSPESIEMQAMHRDAWPDWETRYQAFVQSRSPQAPVAAVPDVAANPPANPSVDLATATAESVRTMEALEAAAREENAANLAALTARAQTQNSSGQPLPQNSNTGGNSVPANKIPSKPEPTLSNPGPEVDDFAYCKRGYKILAGPKKREAMVQSLHEGIFVRVKYQDDQSEAMVSFVDTDECPGVTYGDTVEKLGFFQRGVAVCVVKSAVQKMGAKVVDLYSDNKVRVAYLDGREELVAYGTCLHPSALTGKPSIGDLVPVPEEENNPVASAALDESLLGRAVRSTEKLAPDQILYAEYSGRWLPVRVMSPPARGRCQVHFVGWPSEFDTDWLITKLKLPKE